MRPIFAGFLFVLTLGVVLADPAGARSAGISESSGKQGTICNECHDGGATPFVRFEGPQELAAGAIATFRFVVQSQAAAQTHAGFNVAASAGTLATRLGQGERILGGELTHSAPKQNAANGEASFEFNWTAPAALGVQTLFGAGNSVNRNLFNSGDAAAATTLAVNVIDVTPACAADCSDDGEATVEDLVLAVNAASSQSGVGTCGSVDTSGDLRIDFRELIAAVDLALGGCAQ